MSAAKKPSPLDRPQTPGVIFQPRARAKFQQGMRAIVDAVRPTLGPLPRLAALSRTHRGDSPEILDDGGLIARRIFALKDRDADMGAMFVRQALWRLREEVGDGTTSAAILLQAIYDESLKQLAAGLNAMRLRSALEEALPALLRGLDEQSLPLADRDTGVSLIRFARSVAPDEKTATLLAEIFSVIGADGHLEVEKSRSQESSIEYIEGAFWESGLASRGMINEARHFSARLENALILVTDLEIKSAQELIPVFRAATQGASSAVSLAIFARSFSEDASALLMSASRTGKLNAIGIKTPGTGTLEQFGNLQDMVTLTGGRTFLSATGDSLERICPEDFGRARRVWADPEYCGIVGGKGDPLLRRREIALLKAKISSADGPDERRKLIQRIGRLKGGAARLLVGGKTESEQKHLRERAERAALVIRAALIDGVLPGGGAALNRLRESLGPGDGLTEEQLAARRILHRALIGPALTLAANAGYELRDLPAGSGFNALTGKPADTLAEGILDAAGVVKAALRCAVRSAALALTVDVLVHTSHPPYSQEP